MISALTPEAFRRLADSHAAELIRYATGILGGDEAGARDVVQEAYIQLWRNPPASQANLRAWLFAVCRTRSIDALRKRSRWVSGDSLDRVDGGESEPSPAAGLEAQDRHEALLALVATLPAKQREVVRLKFQNDLSYAEIAEITGLTATNVGFVLHTAMQTLKARAGAIPALRP